MASLKYGCITPNVKAREYPVAASQQFKHEGGAFVHLDSSGHVTLTLTATATIFGYVASVPAGLGSGSTAGVWISSATAGADKLLVIPVSEGAEFIVPADDTVTASMAGNACDLVAVNDGTAQVADVGTSTTDVLLIQGPATKYGSMYAATDAIVKVNPAKVQADT